MTIFTQVLCLIFLFGAPEGFANLYDLYDVLGSVKSLEIYVLFKLEKTTVGHSDSGRMIRKGKREGDR